MCSKYIKRNYTLMYGWKCIMIYPLGLICWGITSNLPQSSLHLFISISLSYLTPSVPIYLKLSNFSSGLWANSCWNLWITEKHPKWPCIEQRGSITPFAIMLSRVSKTINQLTLANHPQSVCILDVEKLVMKLIVISWMSEQNTY